MLSDFLFWCRRSRHGCPLLFVILRVVAYPRSVNVCFVSLTVRRSVVELCFACAVIACWVVCFCVVRDDVSFRLLRRIAQRFCVCPVILPACECVDLVASVSIVCLPLIQVTARFCPVIVIARVLFACLLFQVFFFFSSDFWALPVIAVVGFCVCLAILCFSSVCQPSEPLTFFLYRIFGCSRSVVFVHFVFLLRLKMATCWCDVIVCCSCVCCYLTHRFVLRRSFVFCWLCVLFVLFLDVCRYCGFFVSTAFLCLV